MSITRSLPRRPRTALRSGGGGDEGDARLARRLAEAISDFRSLAPEAKLPYIDQRIVEDEVIWQSTVATIPSLDRINHVLVASMSLAKTILDLAAQREELVRLLQHETCAIRTDKIRCSPKIHERTAAILQNIDDLTIQVVESLVQWRRYLSQPQPFFFRGENILFRFAVQYGMGCDISLANAHVRTTSRHARYFYASPFDAVSSEKDLVNPSLRHDTRMFHVPPVALFRSARELWDFVRREGATQEALCADQLQNARMGLYQPVLKCVVAACVAKGGARRSGVLPITDRAIKKQLIQSYAVAHCYVKRHAPRETSGASALVGFATFSTRSLHIRYFRRWLEWLSQKKEKRERAEAALALVRQGHLGLRFQRWTGFVLSSREKAARWRPHLEKVQHHLMRRFVRKWFTHHAMYAMARQIRRAMFLKYFRGFHLLAVRNRQRRLADAQRNKQPPRLLHPPHPSMMQPAASSSASGSNSNANATTAKPPRPPPIVFELEAWPLQSVSLLSGRTPFTAAVAQCFTVGVLPRWLLAQEEPYRRRSVDFEERAAFAALLGAVLIDRFRSEAAALIRESEAALSYGNESFEDEETG